MNMKLLITLFVLTVFCVGGYVVNWLMAAFVLPAISSDPESLRYYHLATGMLIKGAIIGDYGTKAITAILLYQMYKTSNGSKGLVR